MRLLKTVSLYFSLLKISTVVRHASQAENIKTLMNVRYGCYSQVFDGFATLLAYNPPSTQTVTLHVNHFLICASTTRCSQT